MVGVSGAPSLLRGGALENGVKTYPIPEPLGGAKHPIVPPGAGGGLWPNCGVFGVEHFWADFEMLPPLRIVS